MSILNERVRFAVPAVLAVAIIVTSLTILRVSASAIRQATPAGYGCEEATPEAVAGMGMEMSTPSATIDHGGMDLGVGTPMAEMGMVMAFDRLYIDMMLPHHGSIIAMSRSALSRLEDERLRAIAQRIIDTQSTEQAELRGYRDMCFGSPDPAPLDGPAMDSMMAAMPGMGGMEEMTFQMNAAAQVAGICAAENVDLAFIDLTIPHHEMAVTASETALTQAINPEISAFAQRVVDDQSAEIDELIAILEEIAVATPPA